MPPNTNHWVTELLSWHGHDRGGVRVPFHPTMGRPLGVIVETSLVKKIKRLARDIIDGQVGTPRWIFLIGGPGNGKSEAVEALVHELDALADASGALIDTVTRKFEPNPIAPRRVEVSREELTASSLQKTLRRLIIIQDASAVDEPDQVAENVLISDLADLLTSPPQQEPVFICCANRGLVARSLEAIQARQSLRWLNVDEVTEILTYLLTATGLGPAALTPDRPQCWPLERDGRFAAWPLDLDSIITTDDELSPFEQMIEVATDEQQWKGAESCGDCTSRALCPFYTNSKMLRDYDARRNLIQLLRHSELATGQRWNFRDSFSLCAELIVGQRGDFWSDEGECSPCSWVHKHVDEMSFSGQPSRQLTSAWELALHLYSQSLFSSWLDPLSELHPETVKRSQLTKSAVEVFHDRQLSHGAQIRLLLAGVFSAKLDPALATPRATDSVLRAIEDEFSQSIRQGADTFRRRLVPIVDQLLDLMAQAEDDWTDVVRESRKAGDILEWLRIYCSRLIKRLLGVQDGEYLNADYLKAYELILQDPTKLQEIVEPLRTVLAPGGTFGGSLIRVFGQPAPDSSRDVLVARSLGRVVAQVASEPSDARPRHDMPWVEVRGYRMPLTFELFAAIQAHASGARIASFAPHTRASIDKVKNAIAGNAARDTDSMLDGDVTVHVGTLGILVPAADGTLQFEANGTSL